MTRLVNQTRTLQGTRVFQGHVSCNQTKTHMPQHRDSTPGFSAVKHSCALCANAMWHSISENVREHEVASMLLQTMVHAGEYWLGSWFPVYGRLVNAKQRFRHLILSIQYSISTPLDMAILQTIIDPRATTHSAARLELCL